MAIPVNKEAKKPRLYCCQTFFNPSFLRVLKTPKSNACIVAISSSYMPEIKAIVPPLTPGTTNCVWAY